MIKPRDIEAKSFKYEPTGYSPIEVDSFLDEILSDYSRLYKENIELNDKLSILKGDSDRYDLLERKIQDVLSLTEKAASSTKDSVILIEEQVKNQAKFEAEKMLMDTKNRYQTMQAEIEKLESRYELMKTRVKLLLYSEIELLDKNEIISEKENII